MKIGFIGTGKLGLPVSLMYAQKGHELFCYDVNPEFYKPNANPIDQLYKEELCPENKIPLRDWLVANNFDASRYHHTNLSVIAEQSDLIFLAVQTPHGKEFEGVDRLTPERRDFDYSYLRTAIEGISKAADEANRNIIVIIISTVLPGTIRREILPIMSKNISLCYNPYFIAMGTVANDCLHPEFILLGNHNPDALNVVTNFYKTITDSPLHVTTLEGAEMIKVCYNTFISTKIAMANTIMELCHYCPNTNCDDVIDALSKAGNRLISGAYLRGGMGDGGGCHPRDNIALSWLSDKVGLRYNWFDGIMTARERQTDFLADLIENEMKETGLNAFILGTSFKPNTAIKTGSPAVLLANILKERNLQFDSWDPVSDGGEASLKPAVYFIGCAHTCIKDIKVPEGSVVIDPHRRYAMVAENSKYIPVGHGI